MTIYIDADACSMTLETTGFGAFRSKAVDMKIKVQRSPRLKAAPPLIKARVNDAQRFGRDRERSCRTLHQQFRRY